MSAPGDVEIEHRLARLRQWAAYVDVSAGEDGCWLWVGSRFSNGYGVLGWKTATKVVNRRAHRIAWALFRWPIPAGQCVLHRCDTPLCVNPQHLFLGTVSDNARDMVSKGRSRVQREDVRGTRHYNAKLTTEQIVAIRRAPYNSSCHSRLAREHSVSKSTIRDVRNRSSYKDIE